MPAEPEGPENPLLFGDPPAGRFVSELTMISPHCVSSPAIEGGVLGFQALHLQIGSSFGINS